MVEIIPLEFFKHREALMELNREHLTWIAQKELELYKIILESEIGTDIDHYVEECVKEFSNISPPEGIFYILFINNKPIGMGALRELSPGIGEIKRMFIKSDYRGKGYRERMLKKLLGMAKEFNFTTLRLDTAIYMKAAQSIYQAAGFKERLKYPITEVPEKMQSHWLYFERKLKEDNSF